ncbi:MAG: hypothetical protein AVO34_05185 [Firmicutes bacterium ML8_F2]|jgi:hypothetical protein|nr:MAG: hypothetical protein AVO34_05185 [Firmicutes bacterium ML8_F2]
MQKGVVFVRSKAIEQAKQVPSLPADFGHLEVKDVQAVWAVPKRHLSEFKEQIGEAQRVFAKSGVVMAASPQEAKKYFSGRTKLLDLELFDPSRHHVQKYPNGFKGALLLIFKSPEGALIYNKTMPLREVCGCTPYVDPCCNKCREKFAAQAVKEQEARPKKVEAPKPKTQKTETPKPKTRNIPTSQRSTFPLAQLLQPKDLKLLQSLKARA